jgi:hypothetical protein
MKSPYDRELLINQDVSGFPSFLFYKNGRQFYSLSGVNTRLDEITEQIQMLLEVE